jgi:dTDP-4-dehydrorhamnose 3,5-epimerase-like enzyme
MKVNGVRIVKATSYSDTRGTLSVLEARDLLDFEFRRVFYIYGLRKGDHRGGHAHRATHQALISIHGRFRVTLDDGENTESVLLESPESVLWLDPMVWVDLTCEEDDSALVVLASEPYREEDYIRDRDTFHSVAKGVRG